MKKLFSKLKTTFLNASLGDCIFFIFLMLLIGVSILSIAGNILTHFPFIANIKWFFGIILGCLGLFLMCKGRFVEVFKILLFTAILAVVVFPSWLYGGGDNTITLLYMILVMCECFMVFKKHIVPWIFAFFLISGAVALLTISHFFPHLIQESAGQNVFADSVFQVLIIFLVSAFSFSFYTFRYNRQHQHLARVNQQLTEIANIDSLTGVSTRRAFWKILEENKPLGANAFCLMVDVDNFKETNDSLGHLKGDETISRCAKFLTETAGEMGSVCRFGGDEFVIFFQDVSESHLKEILGKILKGMWPITLSGGVSKFSGGDTDETFVGRADDSLLTAKRMGKNRILLWNGEFVLGDKQ